MCYPTQSCTVACVHASLLLHDSLVLFVCPASCAFVRLFCSYFNRSIGQWVLCFCRSRCLMIYFVLRCFLYSSTPFAFPDCFAHFVFCTRVRFGEDPACFKVPSLSDLPRSQQHTGPPLLRLRPPHAAERAKGLRAGREAHCNANTTHSRRCELAERRHRTNSAARHRNSQGSGRVRTQNMLQRSVEQARCERSEKNADLARAERAETVVRSPPPPLLLAASAPAPVAVAVAGGTRRERDRTRAIPDLQIAQQS